MHPDLQYQVRLLKKFKNVLKEERIECGVATSRKISVSRLENFAQPVEPLFKMPYILDGEVLYDQ